MSIYQESNLPSYENGSSLTRGEFVAHMERVDRTLVDIIDRLDRMENKMEQPKQVLMLGVQTIGSKIVILIVTIVFAYLTAKVGFGWDGFSGWDAWNSF